MNITPVLKQLNGFLERMYCIFENYLCSKVTSWQLNERHYKLRNDGNLRPRKFKTTTGHTFLWRNTTTTCHIRNTCTQQTPRPFLRYLYMYNQKRECTNYYLGMKILYKNECCKNSYMKNLVVLPRVILMLIATRVSFWLLEAKCFMRDLERRNMNGRDIFCKP